MFHIFQILKTGWCQGERGVCYYCSTVRWGGGQEGIGRWGCGWHECCEICGKTESDDLNAKWYGCDVCEMWYHCLCLNEDERLKAEKSCKDKLKWVCQICCVTKYQSMFLNDEWLSWVNEHFDQCTYVIDEV